MSSTPDAGATGELAWAEDRFAQLAGDVGPAVPGYLVRRVDPRDDAADVYQQVLTITWQKLRVVPRDEREAFAWVIGVARRCLSNHRRSGVRRGALTDKLRGKLALALRTPDDQSARAADELLDQLNHEDRELVTLVHWRA